MINATRIQKIKTGGVYTRTNELIDVKVLRSFCDINMSNTIAIDEKPIIINNYKQNSVRVKKKKKQILVKFLHLLFLNLNVLAIFQTYILYVPYIAIV